MSVTPEAPAPAAPKRPFDRDRHFFAAKQQPKSVRSLPAIGRSALRLVRRANPRLYYATAAVQLLQAFALIGQIILAKIALEAVLDASQGDGGLGPVLVPFAGLVLVAALVSAARAFLAHGQRLLGEHVQRTTLHQVLGVTTAVDLETFEDDEFFDDLQRVRTSAINQPQALAQGLTGVLGGLLAVVGLAVVLILFEPLLLLIFGLAALPLWLFTRRQGREEYAFRFAQTPGGRLRAYLLDLMSGRYEAKELRAFDLGPTLAARWDASYATYIDALGRHVRRRVALAVAGALVTALVTGGAFALLIALVLDDQLALAEAGAAILAIRLIGSRLEQVLTGAGKLFEASLFLRDFDAFLARAPHRDREGAAREMRPFSELRLEDVRFAYPDAPGEAVRGVSLSIRAGEVVALVGDNGSGKTTLAKLIAALFTPTGGRVLWDGQDVAGLDRTVVREHVGVIFQDFIRYEMTVGENIANGRPERAGDEAAIREAARQAGADRFIDQLDDGYATLLGRWRGGQDLSLGQWQRLALARAFFRGAGLLVLDEPTASLDARSEAELFERVQALASDRSVLLISHRFSTVKSADRIYVLHHGELVEEGSHDELMAQDGRYAEMFLTQAAAYR